MDSRRHNWLVLLFASIPLLLIGTIALVAVLVTLGPSELFSPPGIPTIGLVVLGLGGLIAAWLTRRRLHRPAPLTGPHRPEGVQRPSRDPLGPLSPVRIYLFWYHRFIGIPIVAALIAIAAWAIAEGRVAGMFLAVYAACAQVLLALGARAVVAGLEFTESHLIVRNPFSTTSIPWERVTRVESGVLVWSDQKGRERATSLASFTEPLIAPRALRRHHALAVAAIRARIPHPESG